MGSDTTSKTAETPETPGSTVAASLAHVYHNSEYSIHAIHLLRTTQNNTLALSQMADQKASILMGATFLVFSLTISRLLNGDMPFSLILLAGFSFLSSLFAVMAVMPAVGKPRPEDPGLPSRHNKLFFGHFTSFDEEEWKLSLLEDLKSDETVFRAMMRDIYQNGQILQRRKYRFLGIAYRIFIFGLFMTLAVFGAELLFGI